MRWIAGAMVCVSIAALGYAFLSGGTPTVQQLQVAPTPVVVKSEPSTTLGNPEKPPVVSSVGSLMWGGYVGDSVSDGSAFEKKVQAHMRARAVFVHWGNNKEFPSDIAIDVKAKGQTLVIFWEAMDYETDTTEQPKYSNKSILRGDWDSYIRSFAAEAKNYGGPIILVSFEEMNGNWYPWAGTVNGNSPDSVKEAYRYIHDLFTGVPNVKFGLDVNSDSVPDTKANSISAYYPGDAYVDYVGVDGFNDGLPWLSFEEIFARPLAMLSPYAKPIFIFSFASAEDSKKPVWIRDAMKQMGSNPQLSGWLWFNENKEKDWRVDSSPSSLSAFREAVSK